jgi:hypothetical protein
MQQQMNVKWDEQVKNMQSDMNAQIEAHQKSMQQEFEHNTLSQQNEMKAYLQEKDLSILALTKQLEEAQEKNAGLLLANATDNANATTAFEIAVGGVVDSVPVADNEQKMLPPMPIACLGDFGKRGHEVLKANAVEVAPLAPSVYEASLSSPLVFFGLGAPYGGDHMQMDKACGAKSNKRTSRAIATSMRKGGVRQHDTRSSAANLALSHDSLSQASYTTKESKRPGKRTSRMSSEENPGI